MPLRVIGAGFGRTGTMSLKVALEQLGFARCYHMIDVLTVHPEHADLWLAAARGEEIDWERLFDGYQASVDWPGCNFYNELMQRYPDAKVILTVRDPERWYVSAQNTIYKVRRTPGSRLRWAVLRQQRVRDMIDALIWNGSFAGNFDDRAATIERFKRHIEEVKRTVPPEQLLIYEVSQGWEPLCAFLGVPVPSDKPFPHLNDTLSFHRMIEGQTRTVRRAAFGVGVSLMVVLALWLRSRLQRL